MAIELAASRSVLAFLHDMIVQIVNERNGIRETDLTMDIIVSLNDRDEFFDPMALAITTECIFAEIQHMVQAGRIVGIDCHIGGDTGYTYLVPAGTELRIHVPVRYNGTRH